MSARRGLRGEPRTWADGPQRSIRSRNWSSDAFLFLSHCSLREHDPVDQARFGGPQSHYPLTRPPHSP
jgi:hypothetical protein